MNELLDRALIVPVLNRNIRPKSCRKKHMIDPTAIAYSS